MAYRIIAISLIVPFLGFAANPELKTVGYLPDSFVADLVKDMRPSDEKQDLENLRQIRMAWAKRDPRGFCALAKKYEEPLTLQSFYGDLVDAAKIDAACPVFVKVINDVAHAVSPLKKSFSRERPYVKHQAQLDRALLKAGYRRCAHDSPEDPNRSFPSMHAAISEAYALLLQALFDKNFQARAQEIRESRNVLAVHYPSDVAGGMMAAQDVVMALLSKPGTPFWRDLLACKAALKP